MTSSFCSLSACLASRSACSSSLTLPRNRSLITSSSLTRVLSKPLCESSVSYVKGSRLVPLRDTFDGEGCLPCNAGDAVVLKSVIDVRLSNICCGAMLLLSEVYGSRAGGRSCAAAEAACACFRSLALDFAALSVASLPCASVRLCCAALPRFRLLMVFVLRDMGLERPCSFRNSPQALHRTVPLSSRRHKGVVEVLQFWQTGCHHISYCTNSCL